MTDSLDERWGLALLLWLAPALDAQVEWTRPPILENRSGHALAYDPVRQRVLLFGGRTAGPMNDTWEWDGSRWTQLFPANSPPARHSHAMAYHAGSGRIVMFGGVDLPNTYPATTYTTFDDTWEWDGSNWIGPVPGGGPSARREHAMAYDAARDRVVLYGGMYTEARIGPHLRNLMADTWEWDGSRWIGPVATAGPSARIRHAMAYDANRGRTVLVGGYDRPVVDYSFSINLLPAVDTWEWDGVTWTRRSPANHPQPPWGSPAVYDPARQRVLLYDGGRGDLWEWDGSNWAVRGSGGPLRGGAVLAYDPVRNRTVLVARSGDTWEWDGSTWTQRTPTTPPNRNHHALVYDYALGRVFMFGGGGYYSDSWTWNGVNWRELAPTNVPTGRTDHVLASDSGRRRIVLFGGGIRVAGNPFSVPLNDTWEWNGQDWIAMTPQTSPSPRLSPSMAYDSRRGRVVLFGGNSGQPGGWIDLGDTWEWDGVNWTQQNPTSPSPRPGQGHDMVYDAARGVVVLLHEGETWEWDGVRWTQQFPTRSPGWRRLHRLAYDEARQRIVMFGGIPNRQGLYAQVLDDVWEYDGNTWEPRSPAMSPPGREAHAMTYDPARERIVMFGGRHATAFRLGETWEYAPVYPAQYTPFGNGCAGSAGTPALLAASGSRPWLGAALAIEVLNVPGGTPVFLMAGLSNTSWLGVPLPLSLSSFGMPGCNALISPDVALPATSTGPTASWTIPIANGPGLVGATFYHQALVFDPNAGNPAGAVVSNGAIGLLGAR